MTVQASREHISQQHYLGVTGTLETATEPVRPSARQTWPFDFIYDSKWIKHIPGAPLSTSGVSKLSKMVLPSASVCSSPGVFRQHRLLVVGAIKLLQGFCKWRHGVHGDLAVGPQEGHQLLATGPLPPVPGKAAPAGPGASHVSSRPCLPGQGL